MVVTDIKKFEWVKGVERPGSPLKDSLSSLKTDIPALIVGKGKKSTWYLDKKRFLDLYLMYRKLIEELIK